MGVARTRSRCRLETAASGEPDAAKDAMPKVWIDAQEIEVRDGENLIDAAAPPGAIWN